MSIQSLGGMYGPASIPVRPGQNDGAQRTTPEPRINTPAPQQPVQNPAETRVSSSSRELPVQAPEGTDPELWSVLTSEERRFFAQAQGMGPVTYGKGDLGLAEFGLQRGVQLDVKV